MSAYGRNPWPRRFGGGRRAHEAEHLALLDALAPGWDTDDVDGQAYAELYAHALAISFIWALSGRLKNQAIPSKMLENLTTWEEACRLRPAPTDSVHERRRRVAAKLRGLVGNTVRDIYDTCRAIAGNNFDTVVLVSPANQINYWPGVNPGPPGQEWSSNRCVVGVRLNKSGIGDEDFVSLRERLALSLDAMLPAWCRYQVGVGSSFVVNQGIVGQTFL